MNPHSSSAGTMRVHPAIARAIERHEPGVTVTFHTTMPFVRSSSGKGYFTKIGSVSEKDQFVGEAEALKAMHIAAPGIAPQLIECGFVDEETAEHQLDAGRPYFVSEYKNIGALTDTSAKKLAERLATEMHNYKSTMGFGFAVPTFCGRTKQDNGWFDSWEQCYDALIGGLLSKLKAAGGHDELCRKGEQIQKR
jgi:protein-ribulosamine 3-kinase